VTHLPSLGTSRSSRGSLSNSISTVDSSTAWPAINRLFHGRSFVIKVEIAFLRTVRRISICYGSFMAKAVRPSTCYYEPTFRQYLSGCESFESFDFVKVDSRRMLPRRKVRESQFTLAAGRSVPSVAYRSAVSTCFLASAMPILHSIIRQ
jgi:hypothetical protein